MSSPTFSHESVIETSERVAWTIRGLFPHGTRLSFERPHLPEALAGVHSIRCSSEEEKLKLNHIRGFTYMNLFAFVEEYIISQTVRHAERALPRDHDAARALLRFAEEELEHQKLFELYCEAFHKEFPAEVRGLGASAVAEIILEHSPLAVMLTTLHLELLTQQHFVGCVKDDRSLEPLFTNLLKHHWMKEAQHAKLDLLELEDLLSEATLQAVQKASDDYSAIWAAFDDLLGAQVSMDVKSLEAATGRNFSDAEVEEIRAARRRSYRTDFLVMGMTNPSFARVVARLGAPARERLNAEVNKYRN